MEKKIKTQYWILILILFMASSELFAQKFQPLLPKDNFYFDSVKVLAFNDTSQIIEWSKSNSDYHYIQSKEFQIEQCYIFVLQIDMCPWRSFAECSSFYVFKYEKELWVFKTGLIIDNQGWIDIKIDDSEKKLIFEEIVNRMNTDTTTNIRHKDDYGIKTKKRETFSIKKTLEKKAEISLASFLDSK
jgi:hypothetical protein